LNKSLVVIPALLLGLTGLVRAQATKVAIIHVQSAIIGTKDGQVARKAMEDKFTGRKTALDKKQSELASLNDQLRKGSATMSDAAKVKMQKDIEDLTKSIQRDGEDFETDLQQEEQKIMNDLGQKIMDVLIKYATQNGLSMVIDVSNPQTPVLWADQAINITDQIVKLYDQAHPGTGAAPAAAPKTTAAPPPAAAPKTAAPPAQKQAPPSTTPPVTKKQ
jgi:outer membrane protein